MSNNQHELNQSEEEVKDQKSKSDGVEESKNPKGDFLKKARMAQGLSIETVHEATKIPMDAIRAIEEGYTVRILTPFYYNGFLKIYATYLNIDVSEVVDGYKKEVLPKPIKGDYDNFDFALWFSKVLTPDRRRQILAFLGIIIVLFLLFKLLTFFTKAKPSDEKQSANVSETKAPKVKQTKASIKIESPKVVVPKPKPEIVKPAVVVAPVVQKEQKSVTLTIRALKKSWLRVKADGATVYQSSIDKDTVETWTADKQIEISGKNINQLEFELNGKLIGTLGRKDRKAKSVIITKDGLKVTKK